MCCSLVRRETLFEGVAPYRDVFRPHVLARRAPAPRGPWTGVALSRLAFAQARAGVESDIYENSHDVVSIYRGTPRGPASTNNDRAHCFLSTKNNGVVNDQFSN